MSDHIKWEVVAGVVIKKDDKYLLVQEIGPRARGLWNWPSGRVEQGDTIEETAVKEAKEETGYDVKLIRKIGIFQIDINTPPKHSYEAEIVGGELDYPKNEIMNAKWFTLVEIKNMKDKLRGEWITGAIEILEKMND
ncbi:NUDIX hydrolase [Patescibacteria group bacterium]|nr:NUDIX hydrolase [Patescibacteria group bacterium]MBU1891040.1 NUDIX hydrolase [Patescibacteria group bacterium]